jgi:hypothetical protein
MPIELEALRLGRTFQPVEMHVEVGDAVLRVETHDFFQVGHHPFIVVADPKGKSDCAPPMLFLNRRP